MDGICFSHHEDASRTLDYRREKGYFLNQLWSKIRLFCFFWWEWHLKEKMFSLSQYTGECERVGGLRGGRRKCSCGDWKRTWQATSWQMDLRGIPLSPSATLNPWGIPALWILISKITLNLPLRRTVREVLPKLEWEDRSAAQPKTVVLTGEPYWHQTLC